MTKVYRILHKPTGLYFCPSREVKVKLSDEIVSGSDRYIKSNLSKKGKAYIKRPSLAYVGSGYYTHLITSVLELKYGQGSCVKPFLEDEWAIVEVE
jgi:hypothetical protein